MSFFCFSLMFFFSFSFLYSYFLAHRKVAGYVFSGTAFVFCQRHNGCYGSLVDKNYDGTGSQTRGPRPEPSGLIIYKKVIRKCSFVFVSVIIHLFFCSLLSYTLLLKRILLSVCVSTKHCKEGNLRVVFRCLLTTVRCSLLAVVFKEYAFYLYLIPYCWLLDICSAIIIAMFSYIPISIIYSNFNLQKTIFKMFIFYIFHK